MNRYGRYGTLRATPGKGDELGELLLEAATLLEDTEGCILYVVSRSTEDPEAVHVFEVWESEQAHADSLTQPGVRELIRQARPILVEAPAGTTLDVLGGRGLH